MEKGRLNVSSLHFNILGVHSVCSGCILHSAKVLESEAPTGLPVLVLLDDATFD
jgi:hypothetical protein